MKRLSQLTLGVLIFAFASACGEDAESDPSSGPETQEPMSGGPCDGVVPCTFQMVEFNGSALPYRELPREDWENPEEVTSGVLSLNDFDGNGDGTWSMRHVWIEKRPSGDLEQFTQLGGDFITEGGKLTFTVSGAEPFMGTLEGNAVTLEGYPFSTKNATVAAAIAFRR